MKDSKIQNSYDEAYIDVCFSKFSLIVNAYRLIAQSNLNCQDSLWDYIDDAGGVLATHEVIACNDIYQVKANLL